jgi:hypothetical protein
MNQIVEADMGFHNFPMRRLEDDEISLVGGGNPFFIAIAGFGATMGALNAAEQFGEKLGKAMYYALH